MTFLETIKAMRKELTLVVSFLAGTCGVATIAVALHFDPIWPVIVMFVGFLLLIGGK